MGNVHAALAWLVAIINRPLATAEHSG